MAWHREHAAREGRGVHAYLERQQRDTAVRGGAAGLATVRRGWGSRVGAVSTGGTASALSGPPRTPVDDHAAGSYVHAPPLPIVARLHCAVAREQHKRSTMDSWMHLLCAPATAIFDSASSWNVDMIVVSYSTETETETYYYRVQTRLKSNLSL